MSDADGSIRWQIIRRRKLCGKQKPLQFKQDHWVIGWEKINGQRTDAGLITAKVCLLSSTVSPYEAVMKIIMFHIFVHPLHSKKDFHELHFVYLMRKPRIQSIRSAKGSHAPWEESLTSLSCLFYPTKSGICFIYNDIKRKAANPPKKQKNIWHFYLISYVIDPFFTYLSKLVQKFKFWRNRIFPGPQHLYLRLKVKCESAQSETVRFMWWGNQKHKCLWNLLEEKSQTQKHLNGIHVKMLACSFKQLLHAWPRSAHMHADLRVRGICR